MKTSKLYIAFLLSISALSAAGSAALLYPVFHKKPVPRHFLRVVKQGPTEKTGQKTILLHSDEYNTDYTGLERSCVAHDPITGRTDGLGNCPVPAPFMSLAVGKDSDTYILSPYYVMYVEAHGQRTIFVEFTVYPELP